MTLIESELRAALRAEAAAHRPDRAAMLDRITRTAMRSRGAGQKAPRFRIAGAAVAVAAVLGGGGFAQWALAGDSEPRPEPAPPTVSVPVSPTPSATPSTPAASSSPSSTRTRPSRRTPKSPLWSDGSVAPNGDTQGSSVVTIKTTEPLTALEVTIRLARTPELVSRGGTQQVPGASVTSTVTEEADVLVYRFVLSSGDTMVPGTYTFSARYTYAEGGRDAGRDSYSASATTGDGEPVTTGDDFR